MIPTLRLLFTSLPFLISLGSYAQADKGCKPPIGRVLWHDRIDREQKNALKADGKADQLFYAGNNEDINYYVSQALTQRIDALQCKIEQDTAIGDQKKKAYLLGMERILKNFIVGYRNRQFVPSRFPSLIESFETAMEKDKRGESIEPIIDQSPYEAGKLLVSSQAFERNPGIKNANNILLRKYCLQHPDRIFITLKDNPDLPFRDSLIKIAGHKNPRYLYDYAAANNRLGYAIRNIDDPFIKTVSKMATSGGSGQLYFPFLDNLIKGNMKLSDIDAVKDDGARYYKLLVKTKMDYVQRSLQGEQILEVESLTKMLEKKGREIFIKDINARHEQPDAVRFKILQQLSPQELYYLVIAGETELYTSSFVKGIYPLMMQKTGNRGDSLLMSVGFDRFKKFIKMAAGYNTLSNFLNSFPDKKQAQVLMTAFVNNLEKSEGLEDGVDVADSYASIVESIKPLADEMLNNTKLNYDRTVAAGNKRGMVIYNLLYKLFLSADSTKKVDLSKEFGIPPVYDVSYQSLVTDSSDKVVMQVFFYGDKDGKMNYNGFLPMFSNANWKKVEDNKYWIAFTSTKGKPVLIYANKPLDEVLMEGELEKGQAGLANYLSEKHLEPSIIIHRGHSYYAPYTIEQIPPTAKIVFLGSCGGYHLIHDVLKHSADAHIIASKQIGKLNINGPFMKVMTEKLRSGSNIDWVPFWKEFKVEAKNLEGFEDYIPPYKNLGAIFIKAYKTAMGEDAAEE